MAGGKTKESAGAREGDDGLQKCGAECPGFDNEDARECEKCGRRVVHPPCCLGSLCAQCVAPAGAAKTPPPENRPPQLTRKNAEAPASDGNASDTPTEAQPGTPAKPAEATSSGATFCGTCNRRNDNNTSSTHLNTGGVESRCRCDRGSAASAGEGDGAGSSGVGEAATAAATAPPSSGVDEEAAKAAATAYIDSGGGVKPFSYRSAGRPGSAKAERSLCRYLGGGAAQPDYEDPDVQVRAGQLDMRLRRRCSRSTRVGEIRA